MGKEPTPWAENTCDYCGETSVCTPSNDFYGGGLVADGKIACEKCFRRMMRAAI